MPECCAKPSSERELVAALREGLAPVRLVGAGHSFSPFEQDFPAFNSTAENVEFLPHQMLQSCG